jgi:hypothetical protein
LDRVYVDVFDLDCQDVYLGSEFADFRSFGEGTVEVFEGSRGRGRDGEEVRGRDLFRGSGDFWVEDDDGNREGRGSLKEHATELTSACAKPCEREESE